MKVLRDRLFIGQILGINSLEYSTDCIIFDKVREATKLGIMKNEEIKYMAWDGKEVRPVSNINFGDDGSALTITFETAPKGKYYKPFVHGESGQLMPYTGEKDEDGKEIYAGYIINQKGLIGEIKFRHGCFIFCSKDDNGEIMNSGAVDFHNIAKQYRNRNLKPFSKFKIIGNIYENPGLLK